MPGFTIGGFGAAGTPTNVAEFRRKHRWRFTVGGIMTQDDFVWLRSAARPNFKLAMPEVHHDQEKIYVAGKQEWDPIQLQFYDATVPRNISARLYAWLQTVVAIDTATVALPAQYKQNVVIETVNNTNAPDEQWTLYGAWPAEVNWQDLDYTNTEVQLCQVTLRYDRARRNF